MEPTRDQNAGGLNARYAAGVVLLVIFIGSTTTAGFLFGLAWGFLTLGLAAGLVAYLLGSE